jgi:hypothetical protein
MPIVKSPGTNPAVMYVALATHLYPELAFFAGAKHLQIKPKEY